MQVFIAAVSLALIVSFLCSTFESVLLSMNHAQVELLAQKGNRSGQLLKQFKNRIDKLGIPVDIHHRIHVNRPAIYRNYS